MIKNNQELKNALDTVSTLFDDISDYIDGSGMDDEILRIIDSCNWDKIEWISKYLKVSSKLGRLGNDQD